MPSFLSCLPSRSSAAVQDEPLLPTADASKRVVKSCIFCNATRENGFAVIYEDEEFVAFHDRTPRAKEHILVIPRAHAASSVRDLTSQDIPMVRKMLALGCQLVPPSPPPKAGFHIPPFSSVPHLHLHIFSGPHTFIGKFKYPITRHGEGEKGYGWFITPDQVVRILQKGGKIDLGRG
ncbi:hypothetical protein L198_00960 [Cryptococcus wingfieldii CBS 7118]|uniref:HIT domain-containing protein n=1 Tax=Cryptococcus wingfieldii CBS 7118 TaxID=1295528 RepID=A0A1E3K2X9_9TREE|nr:hypothetical protein L198_00960 [Cryptococcus wingfieldii CBS 7118]ODO07381.1 hypothetical protein L198_00960 [Cryptococcus wingfieldii CBS 7118]